MGLRPCLPPLKTPSRPFTDSAEKLMKVFAPAARTLGCPTSHLGRTREKEAYVALTMARGPPVRVGLFYSHRLPDESEISSPLPDGLTPPQLVAPRIGSITGGRCRRFAAVPSLSEGRGQVKHSALLPRRKSFRGNGCAAVVHPIKALCRLDRCLYKSCGRVSAQPGKNNRSSYASPRSRLRTEEPGPCW